MPTTPQHRTHTSLDRSRRAVGRHGLTRQAPPSARRHARQAIFFAQSHRATPAPTMVAPTRSLFAR